MAVAVGISYTEYYLNSAPYGMSAYTATSGTLSVVCGRLSFSLGLKVRTLEGQGLRAQHFREKSFIIVMVQQNADSCMPEQLASV